MVAVSQEGKYDGKHFGERKMVEVTVLHVKIVCKIIREIDGNSEVK